MENEKKVKLTVNLKQSTHKSMAQLCKIESDNISYQDFIENAVIYCIKNKIVPEEK